MIDERAFVNGIVGLMATGGSTNHTLHLVAMARAAGILLNWDDFAELSRVMPLLARVYPNGTADVNQFEAAGGMPLRDRRLLDAGLAPCRRDRRWPARAGWSATAAAGLEGDTLVWEPAPDAADTSIVRPARSRSRRGWAQAAARQSRPRRDQDLGGQAATPADRGAGRSSPTRTS